MIYANKQTRRNLINPRGSVLVVIRLQVSSLKLATPLEILLSTRSAATGDEARKEFGVQFLWLTLNSCVFLNIYRHLQQLSVAFLRDSTRKIYSPMIARDQTQANHKTSIRQTGAIRFRNFNSGQTELVATEQQVVSFCLPHRQLWLSSEQLFQGSYALA